MADAKSDTPLTDAALADMVDWAKHGWQVLRISPALWTEMVQETIRLRELLKVSNAEVLADKIVDSAYRLAEEDARLKQENRTLRADLNRLADAQCTPLAVELSGDVDRLTAENARLAAEVERWKLDNEVAIEMMVNEPMPPAVSAVIHAAVDGVNDALAAEVERLRADLAAAVTLLRRAEINLEARCGYSSLAGEIGTFLKTQEAAK